MPVSGNRWKAILPIRESCLPMLRKQLSHMGQAPCPKKYIFTLSITYNFILPTQLWKTLLITVLISCTLSTAKKKSKIPVDIHKLINNY